MYRLINLLLLMSFLFACATAEVGRKYDVAASQKIEIGKTSEAEVISLLGQPLKQKTNEDGTKVFGYGYVQSKAQAILFSAKARTSGDKIIIKFDKKGIVLGIERASLPSD